MAAPAIAAPERAVAAGKPHVVMLVFDEFPADSLLGPGGRIDSGRFPNLARLAGDSTWYPNATTVADWTIRAVPAILDGRWPRKNETEFVRDHRRNIFRLLSRRGYRLHSTEEITSLCNTDGCQQLLGRGFDALVAAGRFERLRQTFRSIQRGRPTFTFHHSLLPHHPWVYLPSGRLSQADDPGWANWLTGPGGFSHQFLTRHSEQRHLLQLGAVDRAIGELTARLRRTRLYDKTMVVITADHGIAFEPGLTDRRRVTEQLLDRIAPIPLIIKRPGQRRGAIDRSYVRSVDIMPTMARILGIRIPWRLDGARDGRPASSRTVRARRRVRMVIRGFAGHIVMGAAEFERRRSAHTARRLRTFGSGSWPPIFRIGPHPELLGRPTSELAVTTPGGVTAAIRWRERYGSVTPRSGFVPSVVAGDVLGGGDGVRDLAVAVNSRIEAVGRSARAPGELFSMLVPEASLRPGRNEIEVFEVRSGPSGTLLVPLGHAP